MERIDITKVFLPPFEEYVEYLKGIWDRNWVTNQGPLVQEFESKLQTHHKLSMPVHCVANGSLGLQVALKALGVGGEVVTTPFSYVATTACALWEGCKVKFADIEPDTLTIDPQAVEAVITPKTEAILATHVFGNPCDVEALEAIAEKHGIALIFDAAHAFGVTYKGRSILEYGDASMVSLHATKLMHSVEGGFIVAKDSVISEKMEWMRRFGHKGQDAFYGVGINAKLSEFHAAMGLCNLKHIDEILKKREAICDAYAQAFCSAQPSSLRPLIYRDEASRNYAYYPILLESEEALLAAMSRLEAVGIYPRRYFYPALDDVPELLTEARNCPTTSGVSKTILCLPLSDSLDLDVVGQVCREIMKEEGDG